jgi:predicted lipoprotein with Yx(FWY)xxD motif
MPMKLRIKSVSFVAATAALALAACGSGGDGSDDAASPPTTTSGGNSTNTVSVADVDGVGDVLVDSNGLALYSADEEPDREALCLDACTSFWVPLEPSADAPTAGPGVPELGVVERPDGTEQITADGRLLYTFSEDSVGEVTGDGFEDDFGDQHLTWHAVRVTETGITTAADGSTDSGTVSGLPGYGD